MQYLVQVSGEISDKQSKTYVIDSDTEETALSVATQNFCEEFPIACEEVRVKPIKRTRQAIWAFVCLAVPILLSLIGWKDGHNTISINPDYISCLYGALLYAAFVVRFKGVRRTVSSWIDITFCVLLVLLLATFVHTILATKEVKLLWLIPIPVDTNILLLVGIVLSWLGLKVVSLACIAGVALVAVSNIAAINDAMGLFWGPLYVLCAFVGIMLYISVEPAFMESGFHIRKAATKGMLYLEQDVLKAKTSVAQFKKVATKQMTKEG